MDSLPWRFHIVYMAPIVWSMKKISSQLGPVKKMNGKSMNYRTEGGKARGNLVR